ncbi:MAG: ligase-associated DNA damage response endonuclease PdeM [Bacteroidota bacterium]
MNVQTIKIRGELLELNSDKTIFWRKREVLFISDLHFGKATHFRKAGIQLPSQAIQKQMDQLAKTLESYNPKSVYFLGDLFHSRHNSEWELFCDLLNEFPDIDFNLIAGNHDILSYWDYDRANLKVYKETLNITPFLLSHHPIENYDGEDYLICGHVHPGVRMKGKGLQSIKLPCFYFHENHSIMPAYGQLTGLYMLRPKKNDQVYVIANDKVLRV